MRAADPTLRCLSPDASVGSDAWAVRPRHRSGNLIIDLDRHRPIDVLPDRAVDTVGAWLAAHRTTTFVSRDRAAGYATAIRRGAPPAVQVADRCHIIRIIRHRQDAAALCHCQRLPGRPPAQADPALASRLPDTPARRQAEATRLARRPQRLARDEQVIARRHDGRTRVAIAQHLRLGRRAGFPSATGSGWSRGN